jgi:hypothetical protein
MAGFLASPVAGAIIGAMGTPSGGNAGQGALQGMLASSNVGQQGASTQLMKQEAQDREDLNKYFQLAGQGMGMLNGQNQQYSPNVGILGMPQTSQPPAPQSVPPPIMMAPQPAPPPQAMPAPMPQQPQAPAMPAQPPPRPPQSSQAMPQATPAQPPPQAPAPMAAPPAPSQAPSVGAWKGMPPGGMLQGGAPSLGPMFQQMLKYPHSRAAGLQGLLSMNKPPEERWSPMSPAQRTAYGIPEGSPAQISNRGKFSMPSSGVTVNTGDNYMDKPLKPADLERYVNAEGNPPDRIMSQRELTEEGYRLQKKPTEADRRAGYVADSLSTASEAVEEILKDPEFNPTSVKESMLATSNWTATAEYQQYKSAADEWATNLVFLRSGATAREEEKSAAFSNFWPQPGDKKATRDFKTELRLKQEINAYEAASQGGRISAEKAQEKIRQIEKKLKKAGVTYDDLPE